MINDKYNKLLEILSEYVSNKEDLKPVELAYKICKEYHEGQVRKSGEPYINHLLEVAIILAKSKASISTIVIGILHDILEDTNVNKDLIIENFDILIYNSILSLTKIKSSNETDDDYIKRLIVGISENRDIILIKLADRLHNMRTLSYVSEAKQKKTSKETRNIYIPISARLGLHWLKSELEDLCFYYLQRKEYEEIKLLRTKDENRDSSFLDSAVSKIQKTFEKYDVKIVRIYGREKHLYSIYKKMEYKNKHYDEIFDVIAVRVIATNPIDCFKILGILSDNYKILANRTKDYISSPKENFYKALHTGLLISKIPLEIQIMTSEMEYQSKVGLSSHVIYKENHTKMLKSNNFLDYIMDYTSTLGLKKLSKEFMGDIRYDLLSSVITVLTPQGDKVFVKNGSTALDFAFKIHTDLGLHSSYAKIDGVVSPLQTVLSEGNIVNIIKDDSKIVPLKSLKWVNTRKAADLIRQEYTNDKNISSNIEIAYGKQILEDYITKNPEYKNILNQKTIESALKFMSINSIDDFYLNLARKDLKIVDILEILRKKTRSFKRMERNNRVDIGVSNSFKLSSGNSSMDQLKFKVCDCSAVYGEEILGEIIPSLIKRERKIIVHRAGCYKLKWNDGDRPSSFIDLEWTKKDLSTYQSFVELYIESIDRKNLLKDLIESLYSSGAETTFIQSKVDFEHELAIIDLKLKVRDLKHLENIFFILNGIVGIEKISRK